MAQNLGLVEPSTAAWTHAISEETYLLGQEETQKVITEFVSTKTQQNEQTTQILCHGELWTLTIVTDCKKQQQIPAKCMW